MFFKNFQPIETERLIIRKLTLTDVHDCFAITSDPRVMNMILLPLQKTLEETKQWLTEIIADYEHDKARWWAVVKKENNQLVGFCGFVVEYPSYFKCTELGYLFAFEYWGQGYATEACKGVIDYGFNTMGLNRIEAMADPENNASIRVLEKLGMSYEGLMRQKVICNGHSRDRKMYALIKDEFVHRKN